MTERLAVIAAGGTGGHMFPAQALAEALLARGWRVQLATDARGARYAGGFPPRTELRRIAAGSTAQGGRLARLLAPLRLTAGVAAAWSAFRRERPAVVAGFGGYPAVPALAAAWALGLPRLIHEQNGIPGRVNRFFAPRVHAVACGIWPTALPAGVTAEHTGNPVRAAVMARAGVPYAAPGAGPLNLLVIGGSQGARILSDLVPAAATGLPQALRARMRVAHQARPEDADRAATAYAAAGITAEVAPFFADVAERMAGAQLVIARAGASTLAELTVIGRPAILIPYAAAAGDHQSANARPLAEAGAAVVLSEETLAPERLAAELCRLLAGPQPAAAMAAAALRAGRPDATERLVALIERLAAAPTPRQETAP